MRRLLGLVLAPVFVVSLATAVAPDPPGQPQLEAAVVVPPRPVPTHATRSRPPMERPLDWSALAACESGGDPRAVSPTGKFRGAFQFSLQTWRWIGMTGDPIDHPLRLQQQAAQRLYARQGRGAWPECGKHL